MFWTVITSTLIGVVYLAYQHLKHNYVKKVPGPPSKSLLFGNLPELLQREAGEADFEWKTLYGDVVRLEGPMKQDYLLISDPKALRYIFHTSGYRFPKHTERSYLIKTSVGHGILGVDGDRHKRQRKVMLPSFGAAEARALLPIFTSAISKLSQKWIDLIETSPDEKTTLDFSTWVSRAALDAIGEGAFDFEFGALEDADNELAKSYKNFFFDGFAIPTNTEIFALSLFKYVPSRLLTAWLESSNNRRLRRLREQRIYTGHIAKDLVKEKAEALLDGVGKKDVMSLIVKANASENPKTRLTEEEIIAQMMTIMVAGHDTTAHTLSWTIFELCKNPKIQERLRKEIHEHRRMMRQRGDDSFTWHDYESMPYVTAVIKETLRFHPIVNHLWRQAMNDDVLPLMNPMTLADGRVITELPIPKGTKVVASVQGYNRREDVFGQDAQTFNPDRWLEMKSHNNEDAPPVGAFANLMTFSAGIRTCIGWRFAVTELNAFLVELIGNFEFTLATPADQIYRTPSNIMAPGLKGQVEKGNQLLVNVKAAPPDDLDE